MEPREALAQLVAGERLSREGAEALFDRIMEGAASPPVLAGILSALALRGETVDEIEGAARAMRGRVRRVRPPDGVTVIDTCGTGGDGQPTFNVSSAVAIVAAAAGATVAKHGNRSNSRPSGSAEGLSALGISASADVELLERCLRECRVAFLFAPGLHPAMRHAVEVRKALGFRTIFNLVGPLTNPAGVRHQLLGVSREDLLSPLMTVLRRLGAERAMVVCGQEGLCDLSPAGPTRVLRWDGVDEVEETVTPADAGLRVHPLSSVFVTNAAESAAIIESVLAGKDGPARDMVLFNAAAALWVSGMASDWRDGISRAAGAIECGAAAETLRAWRRVAGGGDCKRGETV